MPVTPHVGLVSEVPHLINRRQLDAFAAALQIQVDRDLRPAWGHTATVQAYDSANQAPADSWLIHIANDNRDWGIHKQRDGLPYAYVYTNQDAQEACKTCSHELLEMLVDPEGHKTIPGP